MKVTPTADRQLSDGRHLVDGEPIDLPVVEAESLIEQGWAKATLAKKAAAKRAPRKPKETDLDGGPPPETDDTPATPGEEG